MLSKTTIIVSAPADYVEINLAPIGEKIINKSITAENHGIKKHLLLQKPKNVSIIEAPGPGGEAER